MYEKIKTADGTETFFNEEFNEAYHSTKAGAYTESLHKFVLPSRIDRLAREKESVNLLDVGFGLGYNVAVAVKVAVENNPSAFLNVVSVEKDRSVFERIKKLSLPEKLKPIYEQILSGGFEGNVYTARGENFRLQVVFGEGRQVLKNLKGRFDAVFYDPFSPKVNAEMWTVELFKVVKNLMEERAVLSTYSASLGVRKGLVEAGFKIGLVEPVGRKSHSTVATLKGEIPPLPEKERERLANSPYAVPYRDSPQLDMDRQVIKENWERQVRARLKRKSP
ncbi:MAG: hypothetical protein GXN94_04700 [Aquificae bacterium]|nr:hypothetical protein [Aquificota bacterium]